MEDFGSLFVIIGHFSGADTPLLIKTFLCFEVIKQKKEKLYFNVVHRVGEETKLGLKLPCNHKESESCEDLDKPSVGKTLISLF